MKPRLILVLGCAAISACSTAPVDKLTTPASLTPVAIDTVHDKTIYALGLMTSRDIATYRLDPREFELFKAGLADGLGETPRVDPEIYKLGMQDLARKRLAQARAAEEKAGEEILAKAAAEKGAVKLCTGGVFIETAPGSGEAPSPLDAKERLRWTGPGSGEAPTSTDIVRVHYRGLLRDGTEFATTLGGAPLSTTMDQVLPCWVEGLMLMKAGGKARLVCPADAAYGDYGLPGKVKPGAVVTYEIELLEVGELGRGRLRSPDPARPEKETGSSPSATVR